MAKQTIANKTGLSIETVSLSIKELQNLGYITVTRRAGNSNNIDINIEELKKGNERVMKQELVWSDEDILEQENKI